MVIFFLYTSTTQTNRDREIILQYPKIKNSLKVETSIMGCLLSRDFAGTPPESGPDAVDYSLPENWVHIAGKKDGGGTAIPTGCRDHDAQPIAAEVRPNKPFADCFFIHPTIASGRSQGEKRREKGPDLLNTYYNCAIGDSHGESDQSCTKFWMVKLGAATAEHITAALGSPFNGECAMYVPAYRQITEACFDLNMETWAGQDNLDLAYNDIKSAFEYFLHNYCTKGRPFVLAGHSQGSGHACRLLKEMIDPSEDLRSRLICAYMPGCAIGLDTFQCVPVSTSPSDVNCWASWNTCAGKDMLCCVRMVFTGREITRKPVSVSPITWRIHPGKETEIPESENCSAGSIKIGMSAGDQSLSCVPKRCVQVCFDNPTQEELDESSTKKLGRYEFISMGRFFFDGSKPGRTLSEFCPKCSKQTPTFFL